MIAYLIYGTNSSTSGAKNCYGFECWLVYATNEEDAMTQFISEHADRRDKLDPSDFKIREVKNQEIKEVIFIDSYYE